MISIEAYTHPVVVIAKELYNAVRSGACGEQPEYWIDQVCRALLSVGSNWCEGIGRRPYAYERQLQIIARGSAYEAACQFEFADLTSFAKRVHEMCNFIDVDLDPNEHAELPKIKTNLMLDNIFEMAAKQYKNKE